MQLIDPTVIDATRQKESKKKWQTEKTENYFKSIKS